MKADEYKLLTQCVETGVLIGARRFLKHSDLQLSDDDLEALCVAVASEVINEVCEWFQFEETSE